MVICLERGADLHMGQLMPLPLTVSCFSEIQIGFTFLVPAHPGSPRERAITRVYVCVCVSVCVCPGKPDLAGFVLVFFSTHSSKNLQDKLHRLYWQHALRVNQPCRNTGANSKQEKSPMSSSFHDPMPKLPKKEMLVLSG